MSVGVDVRGQQRMDLAESYDMTDWPEATA